MISRKSTRHLAEAFEVHFRRSSKVSYGGRPRTFIYVDKDMIYDFLFERDYDAWFCNFSKKQSKPRDLKEFIMKLHTGETQYSATKIWTREQRKRLGQTYIYNLAQDLLNYYHHEMDDYPKKKIAEKIKILINGLELDGYIFRDKHLLRPEKDVLDVEEELSLLESLYSSIGLEDLNTTMHHLSLSEEHFSVGKWDDSISNS